MARLRSGHWCQRREALRPRGDRAAALAPPIPPFEDESCPATLSSARHLSAPGHVVETQLQLRLPPRGRLASPGEAQFSQPSYAGGGQPAPAPCTHDPSRASRWLHPLGSTVGGQPTARRRTAHEPCAPTRRATPLQSSNALVPAPRPTATVGGQRTRRSTAPHRDRLPDHGSRNGAHRAASARAHGRPRNSHELAGGASSSAARWECRPGPSGNIRRRAFQLESSARAQGCPGSAASRARETAGVPCTRRTVARRRPPSAEWRCDRPRMPSSRSSRGGRSRPQLNSKSSCP